MSKTAISEYLNHKHPFRQDYDSLFASWIQQHPARMEAQEAADRATGGDIDRAHVAGLALGTTLSITAANGNVGSLAHSVGIAAAAVSSCPKCGMTANEFPSGVRGLESHIHHCKVKPSCSVCGLSGGKLDQVLCMLMVCSLC